MRISHYTFAVLGERRETYDTGSFSSKLKIPSMTIARSEDMTDYYETITVPRYYRDLLAWACYRAIRKGPWYLLGMLGLHHSEVAFSRLPFPQHVSEVDVITDGRLLVDNGGAMIAVTIDTLLSENPTVRIESWTATPEQVRRFIYHIQTMFQEHNIYRNQKLYFDGGISFLAQKDCIEPCPICDSDRIRILNNICTLVCDGGKGIDYGVPLERLIILKGTGEYAEDIARGLVSDITGVTSIIADASLIIKNGILDDLYSLAEDLSPAIIFLTGLETMESFLPSAMIDASTSISSHSKVITVTVG